MVKWHLEASNSRSVTTAEIQDQNLQRSSPWDSLTVEIHRKKGLKVSLRFLFLGWKAMLF